MAEFVARRMAGAGAGDTVQEPGVTTRPVTGVTPLTLQCRWRIKRTLLLELCYPRDNSKVLFNNIFYILPSSQTVKVWILDLILTPGYRHCDADYHHPPAEVNWWLPVTRVSGTCSLHTESRPGRGDFAPVSLEYGEVLRFYGNLSCHYTVPNVSDICRNRTFAIYKAI